MASPDNGDVSVAEDDDIYEVERICGKRWIHVRVVPARRAKRHCFAADLGPLLGLGRGRPDRIARTT